MIIENIVFSLNWLSSGAISLFLQREYLPWSEFGYNKRWKTWQYSPLTPFDIVFYKIKNISFIDNKSGLNKSFKGLVNVKSSNWVSIDIENINV